MLFRSYDFLSPLSVDVKNGSFNVVGKPEFVLSLTSQTITNILNGYSSNKKTIPQDLYNRLKNGERQISLDPDKVDFYYYKKDDWLVWANPMIYAILDDVVMLEKMKLADISALDGAISNIRLWTLGDLENKIITNNKEKPNAEDYKLYRQAYLNKEIHFKRVINNRKKILQVGDKFKLDNVPEPCCKLFY